MAPGANRCLANVPVADPLNWRLYSRPWNEARSDGCCSAVPGFSSHRPLKNHVSKVRKECNWLKHQPIHPSFGAFHSLSAPISIPFTPPQGFFDIWSDSLGHGSPHRCSSRPSWPSKDMKASFSWPRIDPSTSTRPCTVASPLCSPSATLLKFAGMDSIAPPKGQWMTWELCH